MFTIGEFSRHSHISARMLRHYDALGLLCPARVGKENGYRYYDAAQLETLARIERLKSYGFTLAEIHTLLPLEPETLKERLQERRGALRRELEELRRTLRRMDADMRGMEAFNMENTYHVILMENPSQKVFGIQRRVNIQGEELHNLFMELNRELERRGLRRAGPSQLLYLDEEFSRENALVEAQAQVEGEDPSVKITESAACAAVTHTGPLEEVPRAYEALCGWLARHREYRLCGPTMERYLKDERMVKTPEELETGVLFPVTKLKEV